MANPLINGAPRQQNPLQYLSQFMQNPVDALRQAGYTIPDGMNNPQQIVNHLINNGQIGNRKLAQVQNMAKLIRR